MPIARSILRHVNSLQRVEFVARFGVAHAQLALNGSEVWGEWQRPLRVLHGRRAIALPVEFANWPGGLSEARGILRFTQRYGPLERTPEPGAEFGFEIYQWRIRQNEFRLYWETLGRKGAPKHWELSPQKVLSWERELARTIRPERSSNDTKAIIEEEFRKLRESWPDLELENAIWFSGEVIPNGEFLARSNGRLIFGAGTLWRFLKLMLFCNPGERLRRCHTPDCRAPYFVARHLNQNYCSEPCARWGQRQHTLRWWNEHGKQARQERKAQSGSKKSQRKRGK